MVRLTVPLKCPIYLAHVAQTRFTLKGGGPILHDPEDLVLDVMVETGYLEDGDEVVHKFTGSNLKQKWVTTVLDTDVGQLGGMSVCTRNVLRPRDIH